MLYSEKYPSLHIRKHDTTDTTTVPKAEREYGIAVLEDGESIIPKAQRSGRPPIYLTADEFSAMPSTHPATERLYTGLVVVGVFSCSSSQV